MSRENLEILWVDDDEDFLLQQRIVLERSGFRVTVAHSRLEAEQAVADWKPAIALVDVMMDHPDDGLTLCHHLRQRYPDLPILLVTAMTAETGVSLDPTLAGANSWVKANAVLTKPIRLEQLTREILRCLPVG